MRSLLQFSKKLPTINQVKGLLVDEAMKRAKGNRAVAARMLGITGKELGQHLRSKNLLKRSLFNGLAAILLLFTCIFAHAEEAKTHVKGQVIVKFKTGTTEEAISGLIRRYEMTIHEKIPQINYYVLNIPDSYSVEEIISSWKSLDIIHTVEPNDISTTQEKPNDELYPDQWGLSNDGSRGVQNADIRIEEAWQIESGNPDVIIAIIDMGFDISHEDLQENIWHNPGEIPNNNVDDDQNGYVDDVVGWDFVNQSEGMGGSDYDWMDEDNDPTMTKTYHGNAVIGIIGATTDNDIGIAGIIPHCEMMLIRAGYFNPDGTQSLNSVYIIKGLIYAADNGAKVINISSGSNRYNQSYKDALEYAIGKGALIVCSAGNEASDESVYPAAYSLPGLISVGSSTRDDEQCQFSNYGAWVDVSAPGEYLMTTLQDNRYGKVRGTSFSAPMVTGIAALIFSKYSDFTPANVQDVIMNSVDVCEGLDGANITSGRVNAYRALMEPSTTHNNVDETVNPSNNDSQLIDDSNENSSCFISTACCKRP